MNDYTKEVDVFRLSLAERESLIQHHLDEIANHQKEIQTAQEEKVALQNNLKLSSKILARLEMLSNLIVDAVKKLTISVEPNVVPSLELSLGDLSWTVRPEPLLWTTARFVSFDKESLTFLHDGKLIPDGNGTTIFPHVVSIPAAFLSMTDAQVVENLSGTFGKAIPVATQRFNDLKKSYEINYSRGLFKTFPAYEVAAEWEWAQHRQSLDSSTYLRPYAPSPALIRNGLPAMLHEAAEIVGRIRSSQMNEEKALAAVEMRNAHNEILNTRINHIRAFLYEFLKDKKDEVSIIKNTPIGAYTVGEWDIENFYPFSVVLNGNDTYGSHFRKAQKTNFVIVQSHDGVQFRMSTEWFDMRDEAVLSEFKKEFYNAHEIALRIASHREKCNS